MTNRIILNEEECFLICRALQEAETVIAEAVNGACLVSILDAIELMKEKAKAFIKDQT